MLDVGIVGCGFAGSAAALFLARAGHRVTIYERVVEPTAVGAGILLQPTGLGVLQRLGLLEAARERGAPVVELACRTRGGRALFHLRYERLGAGLAGLGLHRGALFELLLGAVIEAGADVRGGVEVTGVDQAGGDRARVLGGDGGGVVGEHDVVVVADGARSRLRERSAALRRARPYRWGALWFVGTDEERRFSGALSQVCDGTGRLLGFLPTGLGPRAGGGDVPLVSLFWSLRMDSVDDWRRRGLDAWKREIVGYEPRADALVAQVQDADQILTAGYVDGVMSRFWQGRVAYVGDAAHATSPQLGQGTNLALMDAATLADALGGGDGGSGGGVTGAGVPTALARYSAARLPHVRFYQLASRWLTPLFQSDHRWLGPLRDGLLPLAARTPVIAGAMLRTLAGVKRGLLRPSLPLASLPRALAPPPSTEVLAIFGSSAGGDT